MVNQRFPPNTMQDRSFRTIVLVLLLTSTASSVTYDCDNQAARCGCGYYDVVTNSRIVGGEEAYIYSWSMIVSMQDRSTNTHFCGGSILSDSYILTAAHCVHNETPDGIRIAAGIYNLTESSPTIRHVDAIYIHPDWSSSSGDYRNDIALLHISEPFDFVNDPLVHRTCVPDIQSPANLVEYPANRTRLAIVGWGDTIMGDGSSAPQNLQQTEVFLIHHTDPICNRSLYDIEKQFCAALYEGGKGK
jgi:secreted trypsin-like serine protease